MGKDTREQMCERLGNYDISTETSELKIQWINALLVHAGREPEKKCRRHSTRSNSSKEEQY